MRERQAVSRFAGALRCATVTMTDGEDSGTAEDFGRLHDHLMESYPVLHREYPPRTPGGMSLLFVLPGSDPKLKPLLLSAHQDVVPPGDPGLWTHPPFGGVVADGRIWGRGAVDYKIGLCGMLEAVESLLESGRKPVRGIVLAFGHDEEIGGEEGAEAVTASLERNGVRCIAAVDEGGYICSYPWAPGPAAVVAVAEKGYATVRIAAEAEQGHASVPVADSAVEAVSRAVCALQDRPMEPFVSLPVARLLSGTVPGDGPGYGQLARWPEANALLRTTSAPTVFRAGTRENVLPGRADALVNFRTVPGQTSSDVMAYVRKTLKGLPVTVTLDRGPSLSEPSALSPVEGKVWNAVTGSIAASFPGVPVLPGIFPAATDSRRYRRVCDAVYRFVPAHLGSRGIGLLHSVDESVSVADYLRAVRFYSALLERLCMQAG